MRIIIAAVMFLSFFTVAQASFSEDVSIDKPLAEVSDPRIFNPASGVTPIAGRQNTVLGMVDLSSVISNLRASVLINSDSKLFYGGHIPIITFIGKKSKVEYVNVNAGLVYSSDQKKSDFMLSLGIRLDSYLSKFGGSYPNVQTAKLPAIEIGPFVSYGFNSWMWGGMLSIRLGK